MNLTPRIDRIDQNKIINGSFPHWQRGTSFNQVGNATLYTADRTHVRTVSYGGTIDLTYARSTDVPTLAEAKYVFPYSWKLTVNVAEASSPAASYAFLTHNIEGLNFAEILDKELKVSFWVKSSVTGDYTFALYTPVGTPYQFYKTPFTINSANTWEKKVISIPEIDQPSLINTDTSTGLEFRIHYSAGSNNRGDTDNGQWVSDHSGEWNCANQTALTETAGATFYLTGLKLAENNGLSTNQEFSLFGRNLDEELVACKRYYEKLILVASFTFPTGGSHYWESYLWGAEKRATPTTTVSGFQVYNAGGGSGVFTPNILGGNIHYFNIGTSAQGYTQVQGIFSGTVYGNAEL